MARKSRKSKAGSPIDLTSKIKLTAGYVRLSVRDSKQKGDSIENQKRIIEAHIIEQSELKLYQMYIDDGESGRYFDRPAFTKMMGDAKKGKFNCIVVKDASRFGRSLIDVAYYLDTVLPSLNIRFIAIDDKYDSDASGFGISYKLQSLIDEKNAADIGRKVRSVIQWQMKDGKYVGSNPPFGYTKAKHDCHQLIIDEETAQIVMRIFDLAFEGKNAPEIARLLNKENVATPKKYRDKDKENNIYETSGVWHSKTVAAILSNEVYIGNLVQGKTQHVYNKRQPTKSEERIKVANTHKPIIDPELFFNVQDKMTHNKNKDTKVTSKTYSPNLFVGKIFCAFCGGRLDRKKNHNHYIYRCISNFTKPGTCVGISIKEDEFFQKVSDSIMSNALSLNRTSSTIDEVQYELEKLQIEKSYILDGLMTLYEDFTVRKISKEEYIENKNMLQPKLDDIEQRWNLLMDKQKEMRFSENMKDIAAAQLREFKVTQVLTASLINSLIARIEVNEDKTIFVELTF